MKYPEVSPQVPSGTVEKNEDILFCAKRELFEASGLNLRREFQFLGVYEYYKNHANQLQERNHFLVFENTLGDGCTHIVTGAGVD